VIGTENMCSQPAVCGYSFSAQCAFPTVRAFICFHDAKIKRLRFIHDGGDAAAQVQCCDHRHIDQIEGAPSMVEAISATTVEVSSEFPRTSWTNHETR
jgi:hypothetical protein